MIKTYYFTLDNGVRVVVRPTNADVAYTGVMIGAGTRDEEERENGMAHYIEHTLFKGTESRSARQIIYRMEDVGGEINAYTTKEETAYYAATLPRYVGRTLELLADMIRRPSFPKKETDKERQVIYDEIESYNDSPSELIYDDFENLIFRGYPIARPILGTRKTLRHFTADRARAFMQRTYRPERMVVFVLANVPPERVRGLAERYFGDIPASTDVPANRNTPYIYTPAREQFHRHTHQAHVLLGGRAYPLGHERQLALYLLNNILGGGSLSSRLNLSLREKQGLVYTVESQYTPLSDTGYWSIYFASDPENRQRCTDLAIKELRLLAEKPLSPSALRKALTQLRGQMAISAENLENAALSMAKLVLYHGEAPRWEETLARIESIPAEVLQEVAADIFREEQLSLLEYV